MKRGQLFSYSQARKNKRRSDVSRWANIAGGFSGEVWPEIQPSFRIRPGQTVFTIGSCFARNIEHFLLDAGCRVPMQELRLPPEEWHGGVNSAMNKFHPPAFRQCLSWTAGIFDRDGVVTWADCAPLAFETEDGRVFDLDMASIPPVTRERFLERRQHIFDVFSTAFSADCLMMTPGLIEAWYDKQTGLYIHEAPTLKSMAVLKDRWEFEILTYEQCLADLLAAIDIVRARNPEVKVLITTSPVPLAATFSGQDVRIANTYSKAVLRAVCGAACLKRPLVDYFPSFEAATLSPSEQAWESDRLHVAGGFIGKIVTWMLGHYLEGGDEAALGLQRARTCLYEAQYAEAEAAAREALRLKPDDVEAGLVLSEALVRLFRIPEAEAELRKWIALYPERADLRTTLARAIFRGDQDRAPEAIAEIEAAVLLPTMGLGEFRSIGELVRRRAPPEAAERLNRMAVERFPLHVEAYGALLNVLIDQGRDGEAIEMLRKASELRRAPTEMRLQLAELLIRSGQVGEAEAVAQGVLNLEHGNAAAKALLATLQDAKASA